MSVETLRNIENSNGFFGEPVSVNPKAVHELVDDGRAQRTNFLSQEVKDRFGVLPNFFCLAPEAPEITANLWGFARFAYLDNPLPSLFKERLFVYLSRFCQVRYCLARHVGFLVGSGGSRSSGDGQCPPQTIQQAVDLIRKPFPRGEEIKPHIALLERSSSSNGELLNCDSPEEESVLACAAHVFLQTTVAPRCLKALQTAFGEIQSQHLSVFLAFVRTAHYWTMVHPELGFEDDIKQLLATHEALTECVLNTSEAQSCEASETLLDELHTLRHEHAHQQELERASEVLRKSERHFREVIDALPVPIYTTDAEGRLTHYNRAAVELSGRVPQLGTDHWCVSWKLYYPDGKPMRHDECPMAVCLRERRAVRGAQAIAERPDGTRFWFEPYPTPLFDDAGNLIGGINMLVDITQRKQAEARIQSDADALTKLNELSSRLWTMRNLREGLDEMLAATIEMLGADFGNIQLLDENRGVLSIAAQRGFKQDFLEFFREVSADDGSACSRALHSGERIIVEDVEMDAPFAPILHVVRAAGYRAVQSTPLKGRNGRPLGIISTHFRAVHRPSEQELRRLDLYARQASDFIDRCRADEALRKSEKRFRMLADNMGQLAWICDQLGNVTWYNQRWLDYTGLSLEDMKGWDWSKVQHPNHLERVVARVKRSAETGEPWEDTFPLRGKDGSYRWFLSRAVPIGDEQGNIVQWFGTNTDIEDLKQAREAAETANRVKDEFLATVSHELRTPLNAIMGWTHLLTLGKLDEETSARGLETIARNASAQNQLISDLLDVSRIISGQLRFESGVVDLIPVIEAATEAVRPAADARGIVLQLNLDQGAGLVSGDAMRLQQVVWNLLSNAVKFTPTGGQVTMRLKRENTSVAIIVSDTGEGISAEFLPYIFDRFRQAESTTNRQHDGLGLGLAIVRHLVEAHGGTIRASSKGVGNGATFTVTFPLLAVHRNDVGAEHTDFPAGSAASASSAILKGLRVLVIDDEEDARDLLTIALTQSGAEVRTAAKVRAALDVLDQWKPDVLVSDIGMPGEDGYDLIRTVRALESERGGTIPALALTGYASAEDAARARVAGYQTHMAKPVPPSDLVLAVARLVAERSVKEINADQSRRKLTIKDDKLTAQEAR